MTVVTVCLADVSDVYTSLVKSYFTRDFTQHPTTFTMLRITGKMRKRLVLDLSAALGLGTAAAFGYWFVFASLSYLVDC